MEFYINHTRREIFRIPADEWEEIEEIEKTVVNLDVEEEFFAMVHLIDKYDYYIDPEDRDIFMRNIDQERIMSEQYDEMLRKEEEADGGSTDCWAGWDEAGASFDY